MLHTVIKHNDKIAVIKAAAELNRGGREVANELRDTCNKLEEEGFTQLVLDFELIKLCPSIVFGNLLVLAKRMAQKQGRVLIANPSETVEKAARITGLTTAITMCKDVPTAIAEVGG